MVRCTKGQGKLVERLLSFGSVRIEAAEMMRLDAMCRPAGRDAARELADLRKVIRIVAFPLIG